jgi:predicted nucleotidyltransferase
MTPLETALRAIAASLDGRELRWALVGGLAVSARAEPRTTRDVDVAVAAPNDAAAEALVTSLGTEGWEVAAAVEQNAAGRLATIRLRPPFDRRSRGVVVDVLFASSGIEPEVTQEAERIEVLPGLVVPVARLGHLIALKVLARDDRTRPRDAEDLRGLLAEASDADLTLAREALGKVSERGFDRGRDLPAEMRRALTELR